MDDLTREMEPRETASTPVRSRSGHRAGRFKRILGFTIGGIMSWWR